MDEQSILKETIKKLETENSNLKTEIKLLKEKEIILIIMVMTILLNIMKNVITKK